MPCVPSTDDDASVMTPDTRLQRWSTDAAAPSQRLDYWIGAVCEGFLEMDIATPRPRDFAAELVSAPLGGVQLNRATGAGQDVYRSQRAAARGAEQFFYLLCKTDQAWHAAQGDRQARLLPGDLLLVDSRQPYEFHFGERCDTLSVELPIAWVARWLPDAAAPSVLRIDGRQGFGAALSAFVQQLQPELALAPPLPTALLDDQLGALLALATGSDAGACAPSPLAGRIADAVRARHAEPGLTAAQVAAGLGIGERTLHRALAAAGTPFASLLMRARITQARRLLGDARFDRLSVAEIGRRVGLLDASHFVRVCRRQTGATPAALRRQR